MPAPPAPPGERDRLAVHLVWEAILLVVTGALVAVMLVTEPSRALDNVLAQAGYIGLIASGLALSLRTGTPNLAVGAVAGFTGGLTAYLAVEQGWSTTMAVAAALVGALVIGVVTGVLVALLSVPAWAVTLGVGTLLQAGLIGLTDARLIPIDLGGGDYPTAVWLGVFAVVSVGGGALWLLPVVRRGLSGARQSGEPARWGGLPLAIGAVAGIGGSSLLAGLAGIAGLMRLKAADPTSGQFLTIVALGAVLLGGTSVFGRRAGVTGTAFGVTIVILTQNLLILHGTTSWLVNLVLAAVILVGLAVNRALESIADALNRPGSSRHPSPGPRGLVP
jgi:ribose/xylose/arabinose/galactoside ABC-type transport system permease subunit